MNRHLKALWLVETIRLTEQSGHFVDSEANRKAKAKQGGIEEQLIVRATVLAQQNGLLNIQKNWLSSVRFAFILLLVFAILSGFGLAFTALSQEPVNIFWALISLLGLHIVTLIIWLLSFCFMPDNSQSLFIQLWLWLTEKFSQKQTTQQLIPAFLSLAGAHLRFSIGFFVNLLWTVLLSGALVLLLILLSTRHYSFVWQTTLLSAETFIQLTQIIGKLPALLGFALPDIDTIRQSGELALSSGEARSAWAVWLIGVFVIYGLGVRFILMVICGICWSVSQKRIKLNLNHPDYQILIERLQPQQTTEIIDENVASRSETTLVTIEHGHQEVMVAIEISETWQVPEHIHFLGFINNRQQKNEVLNYLYQNPAKKLLIAIDSDRTPDRGLINLVIELAGQAEQARIWFSHQGKQMHNWLSALVELKLTQAEPDWLQEDKRD
ncbi:DUF2868 domain-containing protein [Zophobihabitans entericus]|uniref:DUF2868 domain-containing protein n=1 Tax=Zophobihabitans entericus TaxID=1635327 RepID=A0A6G9IAM1_9GAMM|nr:DUF2868 domain-containing protein [Zophobihabitans entericus]QIQ21263.1 DUF2868 domain-containing protein [Zophobihabitans entericus]